MPTPATNEPNLPLRYATPLEWAQQVLREPPALLNDHAHLEKKAATNALELRGAPSASRRRRQILPIAKEMDG